MKSGAKNHIHKYYNNLKGVWTCALLDCTHYLPGNIASRINHTRSICWQCGEPFITNEYLMDVDKPLCQPCRYPNATDLESYLKGRTEVAPHDVAKIIKVDGKSIALDSKGNVVPIDDDGSLI